MGFTRATRGAVWLKAGIGGPSGSGKTFTALAIASRLAEVYGGRVAVIDTEAGSSALYGDGRPFDFDVLTLTDFHPNKYVDAMIEASRAGYKVLVIDSITHEWSGKGGVLEIKDRATGSNGNSYTAWAVATPLHNRFVEAIGKAPMHIIATVRAKQEYAMEQKGGSTIIRKLGMGPIQREGMDYEFDVFGMMDTTHALAIEKTRCQALTDMVFPRPGRDVADVLIGWLSEGAPAEATATVPTTTTTAATTVPTGSEGEQPPDDYQPMPPPHSLPQEGEPMATEKQIASIRKLQQALGRPEDGGGSTVTYAKARELITTLSAEYQRKRRAS